jgi:hypothetical protein
MRNQIKSWEVFQFSFRSPSLSFELKHLLDKQASVSHLFRYSNILTLENKSIVLHFSLKVSAIVKRWKRSWCSLFFQRYPSLSSSWILNLCLQSTALFASTNLHLNSFMSQALAVLNFVLVPVRIQSKWSCLLSRDSLFLQDIAAQTPAQYIQCTHLTLTATSVHPSLALLCQKSLILAINRFVVQGAAFLTNLLFNA